MDLSSLEKIILANSTFIPLLSSQGHEQWEGNSREIKPLVQTLSYRDEFQGQIYKDICYFSPA